MDSAPTARQHGVPPAPLPNPRALPLTASVLLGPWPTLLQGGWGGASQHPLHFGAQIHSLWSMNICLDQKISIWSSASMSSPFTPAPSSHALHGELRWKPTGHPHTPRLQPAQGPHSSRPAWERPVPPLPLGAPHDQWVRPTRISSQTAFHSGSGS